MNPMAPLVPRAGFHQSTTTSVEVSFYLDDLDDPVLKRAMRGSVLQCRGRRNEKGEEPMILRVSTSKQLGQAAGTFTLTLAVPDVYGTTLPDFEDLIPDDTWVDIVFISGTRRFHTLRGLVSSVVGEESTSEGTQRRYQIEGWDFGRVFERTPIWFNQFRMESAYAEALQIFNTPNVGGTPPETVRKILYGFLDSQAKAGRAGNWKLPKSMPGRQETFPDTFVYDPTGYTNDQPRIAVSLQFMAPEGQPAWALAMDWSDPGFCELFCDLIEHGGSSGATFEQNSLAGFDKDGNAVNALGGKSGGVLDPNRSYDIPDTSMGVIFRDRPFVRTDLGAASRWFSLPTADAVAQEFNPKRLARSGNERFNAYFVSPRVLQSAGVLQSLVGPLWDPADIERHGLCPFSVDSRYLSESPDLFTLTEALRKRARDFHCLNPYYFSGTLGCARWRPDIRVGQRLRVREADPNRDLWFYVESVTQGWTPAGGTTEVGVTRGWRGTNQALMGAVTKVASRYELLPGENRPALPEGTPAAPGVGGAGRGVGS